MQHQHVPGRDACQNDDMIVMVASVRSTMSSWLSSAVCPPLTTTQRTAVTRRFVIELLAIRPPGGQPRKNEQRTASCDLGLSARSRREHPSFASDPSRRPVASAVRQPIDRQRIGAYSGLLERIG